MPPMSDDIVEQLKAIVGEKHVLDSDAVGERAVHFWDPSPMSAKALVRPANTRELSQVLASCHACNQPVVTHGGVTGLVDGEKSSDHEIVLSLERMNQIESVDPAGRTMTVQAGCVLQTVQEAAAELDLLYGVDLGARGTCTIGGNISTNAGGLSVLRYGMTREQVLGLEAVLADGTILTSMNTLMKNNAGYDLKQLFVGSEGTLGVVTRAVLRLRSATPSVSTAMVAFDNFDQVSATLSLISNHLNADLNAFEILWNEFYQLSTNEEIRGTSRAPLSANYTAYAIIESRGSNQSADEERFMAAMELAMEQGLIVDAVIAQSETERANIWQIRENVDLVLRHQPAFIYDISLPINSMTAYLETIKTELVALWPEVQVYAYGHLADCNLHITVAPRPDKFIKNPDEQSTHIQVFDEEQMQWYGKCNKIMFEPLSALGGSISAEHGIGLLKKAYLPYSRTDEEIETMRLLKRTLDPNNVLNPGKVV